MIAIIAFSTVAIAVAVLAVAHIRIRALRRRVTDLTLLAEVHELLQLSTSVDEAAGLFPPFAMRLLPSCDGALYLSGLTPDALAMVTAWGDPCDVLVFAPSDCWALRRARSHMSDAVNCSHNETERPTLCVPVFGGGEARGVLVLRGARSSDRRTAAVARRLAAQIGRVLANLEVQDTLRMHAVRDELTGLYNRRYLHDALVRELQGPRAGTGVIVADVDDFKRYNDTWGHPAGDALLQHLARMMQRVLREEDIVCRFGGEEFFIIVPDATLELLESSAERLRRESAQMHVRHDGRFLGRITLSAGIAISPRHGTTPEELIAAADRALYIAKTNGRDRVELPPQSVIGLDAA